MLANDMNFSRQPIHKPKDSSGLNSLFGTQPIEEAPKLIATESSKFLNALNATPDVYGVGVHDLTRFRHSPQPISFSPAKHHFQPEETTFTEIPFSHRDFSPLPQGSSDRSLLSSDGASSPSQSSPLSTSFGHVPYDQLLSRQFEKTGVRLHRRKNHIPSLQTRSGPHPPLSRTNTWNASHVNVRRKSTQFDVGSPASITSPISPVNPSPAMSFLSSFVDTSSHAPSIIPGSYQTGDEIGDYTLGKEAGCGTFSRVFEADSHDPLTGNHIKVALKIIPKLEPHLHPIRTFSTPNILTPAMQLLTRRRTHSSHSKKPEAPSRLDSESPEVAKVIKELATDVPAKLPVVIANLDRETTIWSRLRHPHIVEMTDLIDLDDAAIIVCQFASGGTLLDYIARHGKPGVPLDLVQKWFAQLTLAMYYLHTDAGVMHRDIKLENLLLDDHMNLKLADFGLSQELLIPVGSFDTLEPERFEPDSPTDLTGDRNLLMDTDLLIVKDDTGNDLSYHMSLPRSHSRHDDDCAGSLHYTAPEDLRRAASKHKHSPLPSLPPMQKPTCDLWAMGCVLYALLTGSLPFNDSFLPRLQLCIMNGKFDTKKLGGVPGDVQEIVKGLLTVEPSERWNILKLYQHPWVQAGMLSS